MDEHELLARMKLLSDSYAETLPGKLADIERMWRGLVSDAWDSEAFTELLRALHSLAGSGKTFGFPALSEAARTAELALAGFSAGKAAPDQEQCRHIQSLILDLRAANCRV